VNMQKGTPAYVIVITPTLQETGWSRCEADHAGRDRRPRQADILAVLRP
jgi:hypothetical protein